MALKKNGGIVSVDFNVGKLDLSGIKVAGKRKKVESLSFSRGCCANISAQASSHRLFVILSCL